ncbi:hypothetical protein [Beggiatoa leptomitoformis]|uniref:SCP-2 sterol transfer family protein n=1 Tax=Beggiatoa leptomitoformis TaxID=288004 RepID=A0A2N9YA56_9GAMM|nr:hypothetical protein [Beggiatoa leptomitoformis]ALG67238.1 SCP-2 sterol transfer family protein [Beggiatoa leptomitoformis]AUI67343.1 SCP-2 sterol transfer family protein [Beggiatoa leptomitoformis]
MAGLFTSVWMQAYMAEWNKEPDLSDALAKINFSSTIAYGFPEQEKPIGVIVVKEGKVVSADVYKDESLNWDLRATEESWQKWMDKGIGMTGLSMAYLGGKLKFKIGDYTAMIKDPRMAGPFIKSFSVMGRVKI